MMWGPVITVVITLLYISSCQQQQQTFLIRSADSSYCPVNATSSDFLCKDLSSFVTESVWSAHLNLSLLFLPGNHYLKENLLVSNIKSLLITPYCENNTNTDMAADTKIHITCLKYRRISIHNVYFLKINSIVFHSCGMGDRYGALLLRSVLHIVVSDSVWNESNGSAIIMENSNATLTNLRLLGGLCSHCSGGGIHAYQSNITYSGYSVVQSNTVKLGSGGGLFLVSTQLSLYGNLALINNTAGQSGGGMSMKGGSYVSKANSSLVMANNKCSSRTSGGGGGMCLDSVNVELAGSTVCINNSAIFVGGGICMRNSTSLFTGYTLFHNNTSLNSSGGGLYVYHGSMVMRNSTYSQNLAVNGGAIHLQARKFTTLILGGEAKFVKNNARKNGGAISIVGLKIRPLIHINGNILFVNNSAQRHGGVLYARGMVKTVFFYSGTVVFTGNSAGLHGGGIYLQSKCTLIFKNNVEFTSNRARIGGALYIENKSRCVFHGEATFTSNTAGYTGGAMNIKWQSNITFHSVLKITKSRADWAGGGISLTDAKMFFHGLVYIQSNEAGTYGGALIAESSKLFIKGSSLFANNKARYGGAIHAMKSNLEISGKHSFMLNLGESGGGLSLAESSFLNCSNASIVFDSNYATQYGGGIWVEDTFLYRCVDNGNSVRDCFFRVNNCDMNQNHITGCPCSIDTHNNTATLAGSNVYGGNVDNCLYDFKHSRPESEEVFNTVFYSVNQSTMSSPVSSDPKRICLCQRENELDCTVSNFSLEVFSGEQFGLLLVAVGQRNGTVPAKIIAYSDPLSNQPHQSIRGQCSVLNYTLSTAEPHVNLMLYPENNCNHPLYIFNVLVTIKRCPPGFVVDKDTKSCVCDGSLQKLNVQCDINSQSFAHVHGIWLSFSKPQYINQSQKRLVLMFYHSHCPFDYCINEDIKFTINTTDKQCMYNRHGLLCGTCKRGYSLTLGRSRCAQCSYKYLLLIPSFAFAGVALVVFLLILKLTVSAGTLNGLIFFANIIEANSTDFLPQGAIPFLRVFIAWLNLDLGIDTCLFPGLDMYTKVWLQFVFPLYVWVLIGVIIVISKHSALFTKLLGDDPVSVLATLFLFSYTKLLRTILIVISLTHLQVSDGSMFAVWLYDANVRYLSGKHIPLSLFALVIFLFLFIPYTLVLLASPHLQPYTSKRILSWIDDYRLKQFLRSYYAPLKDNCCSWIGLLLILRFSLLLVSLINEPSINLVAISITTLLMVSFKVLCGTVYTNWRIDALDLFFEVNLGLFSVFTLYIIKVNGNQTLLCNIFLSVSFLAFSAIILYHIQRRVVGSRWWMYLKLKSKKCFTAKTGSDMSNPVAGIGGQHHKTRPGEVSSTHIELQELLLENTNL